MTRTVKLIATCTSGHKIEFTTKLEDDTNYAAPKEPVCPLCGGEWTSAKVEE